MYLKIYGQAKMIPNKNVYLEIGVFQLDMAIKLSLFFKIPH